MQKYEFYTMIISCVQRQANGNEDEEAELVKSWEKDKV